MNSEFADSLLPTMQQTEHWLERLQHGTGRGHLIDPKKTTSMGKPVGNDSSLSTWKGDQWKIGGGTTWGWYAYDSTLNLMYYGSGNPST